MATTTADNIQIIGGVDTHQDRRKCVTSAHRRRREPRRNGAWYRIVLHHPSRLPGDASLVPLSWRAASCRSGIHRYLRSRHHACGTWHSRVSPCSIVTGPDPASRRAKGKDEPRSPWMRSAPVSAAEAARTRRRVQVAKDRSGSVEALRVLRTTRKTAIKCRRAALQQLHNTIVAAPEEVRRPGPQPHPHAAPAYLCGLEAGHQAVPRSAIETRWSRPSSP